MRFKPPAFTESGLLRFERIIETLQRRGIAVTSIEIEGGRIILHSTADMKPEQDETGDSYLARLDPCQERS